MCVLYRETIGGSAYGRRNVAVVEAVEVRLSVLRQDIARDRAFTGCHPSPERNPVVSEATAGRSLRVPPSPLCGGIFRLADTPAFQSDRTIPQTAPAHVPRRNGSGRKEEVGSDGTGLRARRQRPTR